MQDRQSISRIAHLITGYIASILSSDEAKELEKWVSESYHNQLLFAEMTLEWTLKLSGFDRRDKQITGYC